MKGECGVMCNELSKTAFEHRLPSLLHGIFMISLSHHSEPILLVGPSGFKTLLSEYFLKEAEVITLNKKLTVAQLLGSQVFLTNSEAKIFYLEQICKICRIKNKYSEFSEKLKKKQLKKEDITDCINIFQFPEPFKDAIHRLIDKLFNYDKCRENKSVISNITIEFQPGPFLSAILQGKSLVLKNLSNISYNERLKLNKLFSININNKYTSLILK